MLKGEIWMINLDPTVGAEIQKIRPAVIVSEDAVGALPLRIIVPLTTWKERYRLAPWMVFIEVDSQNGLEHTSAADAFQIRSVAQQRFVRKMGVLQSEQLNQILEAIQLVIGVV
jgi:mRNA interferase MazF